MWEATFKMSPFCFSFETTPRAMGKLLRAAFVLWLSGKVAASAWAERGVTQKSPAHPQTPLEERNVIQAIILNLSQQLNAIVLAQQM